MERKARPVVASAASNESPELGRRSYYRGALAAHEGRHRGETLRQEGSRSEGKTSNRRTGCWEVYRRLMFLFYMFFFSTLEVTMHCINNCLDGEGLRWVTLFAFTVFSLLLSAAHYFLFFFKVQKRPQSVCGRPLAEVKCVLYKQPLLKGVMQRGVLGQLTGVWDSPYGSPSQSSPALDLLWQCYEEDRKFTRLVYLGGFRGPPPHQSPTSREMACHREFFQCPLSFPTVSSLFFLLLVS